MKIQMSSSAGALLRALIGRSGAERNRILLTNAYSTDWQSLTFDGERHHFEIRIAGPGAAAIAAQMCDNLSNAEFSIAGRIVADVCLIGEPRRSTDGAIEFIIEGLTIADD